MRVLILLCDSLRSSLSLSLSPSLLLTLLLTPLLAQLFNLTTSSANVPHLTDLSLTLYFLSEEFEGAVDAASKADSSAGAGGPQATGAPPPPPAFPASLLFEDDDFATWICPHCTLINEDFATRCAACLGKRQSSEPPPPLPFPKVRTEFMKRSVRIRHSFSSQHTLPHPSTLLSQTPKSSRPHFSVTPITVPLERLSVELRIDDEPRRKVSTFLPFAFASCQVLTSPSLSHGRRWPRSSPRSRGQLLLLLNRQRDPAPARLRAAPQTRIWTPLLRRLRRPNSSSTSAPTAPTL